jgi:uncharacterized protein (TIGR03066 family)
VRSGAAAGLAVLALALTAVAGPIEGSKLIGVWELTKVEGKEGPHWRIEFSKDGKLRMTSKRGDKEYKAKGTYALKKDRLTLTVVVAGKTADTRTVTVQTLKDKELVFLDNKKKMEFKRAK